MRKSIHDGLNPANQEAENISFKTKTDTFKEQNVEQPILMIGIRRDKESTNELIAKRIKEMIN